jgi:spore coat protein CotF
LIKDFLEVENAEGFPELADSAFAMIFLMFIKNGIRNTAAAITETTTPEVRHVLRTQLEQSIALQKEIAEFMVKKGWLHPYDPKAQFEIDMKAVEAALVIGGMNLFPQDTSRRGLFADLGE